MKNTDEDVIDFKKHWKRFKRTLWVIAKNRFSEWIFRNTSRDWVLDIGPIEGKKGESKSYTLRPQCLFRGEKLVATDTSAKPGCGTRITQIMVGCKLQKCFSGSPSGILTHFFSPTSLGNGIKMDPCLPGLDIVITVYFIEDCVFDASLFGKAAFV